MSRKTNYFIKNYTENYIKLLLCKSKVLVYNEKIMTLLSRISLPKLQKNVILSNQLRRL